MKNKQTKQEKDVYKTKSKEVRKERHQSEANKKENSTSTPKLSNAWGFSHEVIFPMQPLVHLVAHVSESMIIKKYTQINQYIRNIKK